MQNPSWRSAVLSGMASLTMVSLATVLIGCSQSSTPPVAGSITQSSSDLASSGMANMDWEMQWAQAALERNPNLEVIHADREQRAFTVRDRHNAMTAEVQLAQIAATPIEFLSAPSTAPTETAEPEATAPGEPTVVTRLAESSDEPEATQEQPADSARAQPSARAPNYTIDRANGRTRVTGDGISVVYGDTLDTRVAARAPAEPPSQYTVDRSSGLVRINGPGVSIEASGEPAALPDGAEIEPVICEGPRVMQLDNRIISVQGDALTARGGCELYITNSTVVASGTGVVIGDATVHINNSRIRGGLASFDAKARAKVFLRGSTLNGLPRRNGQALIQDQGGNQYQ